MSIAFCAAPSRAISRSSSRRNSSLLSTSRPPRRSASPSRRRCWPLQTRCFSERREFIAGLGSAAAWPVVARTQQTAMPVIGYLSPQYRNPLNNPLNNLLVAFLESLKENGFVDGRNVAIEYRWAEGQSDRPGLAVDLVRRRVAVIVANGVQAA